MGPCTGTGTQTELEFVHALRTRAAGRCCGPAVILPLVAYRIEVLESAFTSRAHELLWDGLVPVEDDDRLLFRLCAAHWMDLSYLVAMRGRDQHRGDWLGESVTLLKQICQGAGWDLKEVGNMMQWQRVALT